MNRLTLAQALIVQCGAANVSITTTLNQTGEAGRFVGWVDEGWSDVQLAHDDWEWMRSSQLLGGGVSFVPNAGQATVPFGSGAGTLNIASSVFGGKWVTDSFRNYPTASGTASEIFMEPISYDGWRDAYYFGANRSVRTQPVVIAVAPDKSLCLGPPSNGLYTVTGDYYTAPTAMVADADTPSGLPNQFHMLIVYAAMKKYALYEPAPEVMQRAEGEYDRMFRQLDANHGPTVSMGGCL